MKRLLLVLLVSLACPIFGASQNMRNVGLSLNVNLGGSSGLEKARQYHQDYSKWLSTQGFTHFSDVSYPENVRGVYPRYFGNSTIIDKDLPTIREYLYGHYDNGSYVAYEKTRMRKFAEENISDAVRQDRAKVNDMVNNKITQAAYDIDIPTLNAGIKAGHFKGSFVNRLRIQEDLLGKLAVTSAGFASVSAKMKAVSEDAFIPEGAIVTAFAADAEKKYKQTRFLRSGFTKGLFNPVDFFAGYVVINNTPANVLADADQNNKVLYGHVGFIPGDGFVNSWNNANSDSTKISRSISLIDVKAPDNHLVTMASLNGKNVDVSVDNVPYSFNNQQAFFQELAPWAVIIEFSARGGAPIVRGLTKLSIGDFGNKIKVKGSSGVSDFTMADALNAPYSLYKTTYNQRMFEDQSDNRTNYPFTYIFLRGLFNGHLESSKHQQLNVLVKTQKVDSFPWIVPGGVPWPAPEAKHYFADNNGLDWQTLRALRVTKAAERMQHLRKSALTSEIMDKILANPTADQSRTTVQSTQNTFDPYANSWESKPTATASIAQTKTEMVYAGATKDYVPVVTVINNGDK
jgi:hypothetical protein